jgi:hypothetical protein
MLASRPPLNQSQAGQPEVSRLEDARTAKPLNEGDSILFSSERGTSTISVVRKMKGPNCGADMTVIIDKETGEVRASFSDEEGRSRQLAAPQTPPVWLREPNRLAFDVIYAFAWEGVEAARSKCASTDQSQEEEVYLPAASRDDEPQVVYVGDARAGAEAFVSQYRGNLSRGLPSEVIKELPNGALIRCTKSAHLWTLAVLSSDDPKSDASN